MRPLYSPVARGDNIQKDRHSNAGLWFDKFCHTWPDSVWSLQNYPDPNNNRKKINPKQNWLRTLTKKNIGDASLIDEICIRQLRLAKSRGAHDFTMQFSTVWRFVTGLGRQHPVENGFTWHPTLGVPYLPGSSVKGLVRAWAEQWEETGEDTNRIFGPEQNDVAVGSVIFLDALPVRRVQLEEDIMTPHFTPYYESSGKQPPGDWYDPIPIPFLTVAPGQDFQFAIMPRRSQNTRDVADTGMVRNWLKLALEYMGAGAKTAVGYGRFKNIDINNGEPDTESWEQATVKYTPNDGKFTLRNTRTNAIAICPPNICMEMRQEYKSLSKTRQKKAKGVGLPCTATVLAGDGTIEVQVIFVNWTGGSQLTYKKEQQ